MNATDRAIACIGGIDVDRKARLDGKLHLGTSNPLTLTNLQLPASTLIAGLVWAYTGI